MKLLIYTVALDSQDGVTCPAFAQMAKILMASLLRTFANADTTIFHNSSTPLFCVQRSRCKELHLFLDQANGKRLKFQVRKYIDAEKYDWVCFLDCDMLAQRNIDHLFPTDDSCDILWQPEGRMIDPAFNSYFHAQEYPKLWSRGANSGSFAVRGKHYQAVMEEWERQ